MMGHREPLKNGAEWDAFTGWRRFLHWKRGALAKIKAQFNRRARREARRALKETSDE